MLPILHLDNLQLAGVGRAFQPPLLIDHPSQLAHCQAMQDRKRIHPHKALETRLTNGAIHKVVRIGTIEHDKRLMMLGTSLHHIVHRTDIGIETSTHILNIEHDDIHIGQLLARRFLVFPIDRDNRHAGLGIAAVFDFRTGIACAPESMFRGKHLMHINPFRQ